jgi:hypothetical protein
MNQVQWINCRVEFRTILELVRFIASPRWEHPKQLETATDTPWIEGSREEAPEINRKRSPEESRSGWITREYAKSTANLGRIGKPLCWRVKSTVKRGGERWKNATGASPEKRYSAGKKTVSGHGFREREFWNFHFFRSRCHFNTRIMSSLQFEVA